MTDSMNEGALIVQQIREICAGNDMTQKQIAEVAGVPETTIRRFVPMLIAVGVLNFSKMHPITVKWDTEAELRLRNLTPWFNTLNQLRQQVSRQ
jgi:DNA-binding transcriptional regulator LsrR (DeoR family)